MITAILGFSPKEVMILRAAVTMLKSWSVPPTCTSALQGVGVVALHDGVKGLVQVNGVALVPAQAEILAGQELLHGEVGCQPDQVGEIQLGEPLGVVAHDASCSRSSTLKACSA